MNRASATVKEMLQGLSEDKARLVKLMLEAKARQTEEIHPAPRHPVDGLALMPMSWAQQRLWFIDQLEGDTAAYHIAVAFRFKGALDEDALRSALDAIVQRHEMLRTVFVSDADEPKQAIRADGRFTLEKADLGAEFARFGTAVLEQEQLKEFHRPFDLSVGPLIRGRLLRLRPDEHVLLIVIHHIAADGWSIGVLLDELSELYVGYASGNGNQMELLRIQYADYAQWQRQWLGPEILERQLAYWRERLDGAPPQLELPADRPRPTIQSYRGRNCKLVLDAQLTGRLRALAQLHNMTLFMVLYAGWSIVLSRLSGRDDIVIGTPVANRGRPELERLIGFFVNSLVLRVEVDGGLSIPEWLQRIRAVTLEAYQHQDVPFEQVVEAVQPERSLSRNPLFQVMLALQNAPMSELRLPDLQVTLQDGVDEPAMFDLLLSLYERGGEIIGNINYAADLFDRSTIERWMEYFKIVLKGLTDGAVERVADLPMLSDFERDRLVREFNATAAEYPQEQLIHELFEAQATRTPAAVAVEHEGRSLTYEELNAQANRLARYLRSRGVRADRPVAVCFERSLEMVVGVLGVLKAGGAYLPLDPNYPADRLQQMVEDATPTVVLTQAALKEKVPQSAAQMVVLEEAQEHVAGQPETNLSAAELELRSEQLVYVIYTSGSTGRPKGTAMAHRSVVNLIEWHRGVFAGREGKRVLQFAALSFDVAFQELFTTMCLGGTLVLIDEWVRRDARALTQFLRSQRIERLFVPPLMLQSVAESCQAAGAVPEHLEDVITAGEQLRVSEEIRWLFAQLPGCRLHNHYGPTETHVVTALTLSADPQQWPVLPTIGRPIANTQIYVLDGRQQPVPLGVSGEIYIGGANVARGYLHRPELTAERFVRDPFSEEAQARLYRTGDVGRWREDGTLEYLGRNDDQVKIRGFRVELGEIETQLASHAQVREAAVVAREEAPGQKRLVGYVVARPGEARPSVEELRLHLKARLPEHMVPSAFVLLEGLPLTPSGKLDRRALPAPEADAYVSREYEAPQGEVEEILAGIWQELLKVERVGRHDNFFELGGHSLLAVRLVAAISKQAAVNVSVATVFRYPTIAELAEQLELLRAAECELPGDGEVDFEERVL